MKEEISALHIHYLLKELQCLVGGKLDKIYQLPKRELYLQIHVTGKGKHILRIVPGKYMYLTDHKPASPKNPLGYCMYLRKYIGNARIKAIQQKDFERIVEIILEVKKDNALQTKSLIIELISKGNIILVDEENKIMSPLETQVWKDRTIRAKQPYVYPQKEANLLTVTKEELKSLSQSTNKGSVVKWLAVDFGLGGLFAEELCLLSKVHKIEKPRDIRNNEIDHLHEAIQTLLNKDIQAIAIMEKGEVLHLSPFPLQVFPDAETKTFPSLHEAMDELFTTMTLEKQEQKEQKTKKTALTKVEVILEKQQQQVNHMRKAATENQRKGELIYENYPLVEEILSMLKKAREKYSWAEIKEKIKDHSTITSINEKEGTITIEL